MSQKIEFKKYFLTKVNDKFIQQNAINIYTLAAKVEKIEDRIYKKVS